MVHFHVCKTGANTLSVTYLNFACGDKICRRDDWLNCDGNSHLSSIKKVVFAKRLPFEDLSFKGVYASQFIEHLNTSSLENWLQEVNRILKPGGICRVVSPDHELWVEEIFSLYAKLSRAALDDERAKLLSELHWLKVEFFDQVSRDTPNGQFLDEFLKTANCSDNILKKRFGASFALLLAAANSGGGSWRGILDNMLNNIPLVREYRIGKFRSSGEIHRYYHDKFSLSRLADKTNFSHCCVVSYDKSGDEEFILSKLDQVNGIPLAPNSLHFEFCK